ncbi:hypothetical protein RGUI_2578 [Rhodovulum sp. P5]|nr:hypothetical protein RGUI_2578 [Rhodovulum sp. P5]
MLAAGGLALGAAVLISDLLAYWVPRSWLSAPLLLPLAGLGLGLSRFCAMPAAGLLLVWLAGAAAAVLWRVPIMDRLAELPGAVSHDFLTLPIAALAIGGTLVPGGRATRIALWPAALIGGGAYAMTVKLSDPGDIGDPTVLLAGLGLGLWVALTLNVAARIPPARWAETASRILGSWLIAIGLIYGSLALPGNRPAQPTPPPERTLPPPRFPDFGETGDAPPADVDGSRFPFQSDGAFNPERAP